MRTYKKNKTVLHKGEFLPKNIQYEIFGRIPKDIRKELQFISEKLLDSISHWIYDKEEDAYIKMYHYLDELLKKEYFHCREIISEHVSFTIVF